MSTEHIRLPAFDHNFFIGLAMGFVAANRKISRWIEKRLPSKFTLHLHTVYKYQVADVINTREGPQLVYDIGGGKECPFLPFVARPHEHLIVGLDCAEGELRLNTDLHCKVIGDAAAFSLPFADRSADLVVSRSVVEHIHDSAAFFRNCAHVLRPGGVLIHTFPGRYAPFALLNQILPNWLARRLLSIFHPAWKDECGFRAFYDCCYYTAVRNLLNRNGFEHFTFWFRFYQSIYFDFFVPLYVLMLAYDLTTWALGIPNLACGIMVRAEMRQFGSPIALSSLAPFNRGTVREAQ